MEDKPRELELNFDSGAAAEQIAAELETANFTDNVPPVAAEEVDAAAENVAADSANDVEVLLRSRHPANRPAGTPPLPGTVHNTVSAMETAIAGKSYGMALRLLREQQNMSFKELEQLTRIQPRFLEALENEDLKVLPPLVYVIAYIRTLCRIYKLSDDTSQKLVAKLKEQLEYSCNDELMNTLDIDRSGAAANELKLKKIIFAMAGLAVGVIAVIVLIVVLAVNSGSDGAAEPVAAPSVTESAADAEKVEKFDPNSLYSLLEPPALDLPKLPVAE
ncbi:MAG: helix-turn-helix domain-containing protein [Lentisphaerae bacterium]|nr:helix-turn-helix domain-containing protein [Lentisphaerota bacterium]